MRSKLLYIVVLVTAFLLDAVVIYVFTDPLARVTVGLLFFLPILWAADALGIADVISDLPATRIHHRQYGALRSHVRLLLDVVRRLNWLAVDLERGIRSEDEVREEMNQAHDRLKGIVEGIRDTVGPEAVQMSIVYVVEAFGLEALREQPLVEAALEIKPCHRDSKQCDQKSDHRPN